PNQRLSGVVWSSRQLCDDLGRRTGFGLSEGGTGPQGHAVRVVALRRCRLQWTGEFANLWKPEGCLGLVLVDESIAQSARVPSRKCPRDNGFSEVRVF